MVNAYNCWSLNKHQETVEFVIGITPQDIISYISEAWRDVLVRNILYKIMVSLI